MEPDGSGVAYDTAVHLTGPYRIENFAASGRIVVTNKVPNAPYRGAGRPEAAFAMERTIDLVARTLGLEPAEVRRRNMIRGEMPYRVGMPYRDGEPIVYDSGDYPAALEKALAAVGGVEAFGSVNARRGYGAAILGSASAFISRAPGSARSRAPLSASTRRARFIFGGARAARPGDGDDLRPGGGRSVEGVARRCRGVARRTASIAIGFGTMASRSTVTLSAALHHASESWDKVFAIAANILECASADLELRNGGVGVVEVPGGRSPARP